MENAENRRGFVRVPVELSVLYRVLNFAPTEEFEKKEKNFFQKFCIPSPDF
jgi:hypothetical protein